MWGRNLVQQNNVDRVLCLAKELTPMNRLLNNQDTEEAINLISSTYSTSRKLSIPSGTESWGWRVPPNWVCVKAEVRDSNSQIIIDGLSEETRVFPYSPNFKKEISREELTNHLMFDENRPNLTPFHFRNQYKEPDEWEWGFSIPYEKLGALTSKTYTVEIIIETTAKDLLQLELCHRGFSTDSYILLGHLDHPGQLNDGLIGVLVAFEAVNILKSISTRFSYKALATMEILGTQLLLSHLPDFIEGAKEAIFLTCLSLDKKRYYQTSFFAESSIDRIFKHFARTSRDPIEIVEHRSILGNDENIFDSLGIEIPCGTYLRWPHDNYHTNGDNLELLDGNIVRESLIEIIDAILVLERNTFPIAQYVGVPRLSNSSYNLYLSPAKISGINNSIATNLFESWMSNDSLDIGAHGDKLNLLMRNTLRMSNGKLDLLSIADRTQVPFHLVYEYIKKLELSGLVALADKPT